MRRSILVQQVAQQGKLPVVLFCAGGIAAGGRGADDAAGRRGQLRRLRDLQVFRPGRRARAIVEATTHFEDPERVAAASRELEEPMPGLEICTIEPLQNRGW